MLNSPSCMAANVTKSTSACARLVRAYGVTYAASRLSVPLSRESAFA